MILTAYDWEEIAEEAKKVGVNAFLAKPLFRSKLYNVMLELLSDRQQLEQPPKQSLLVDNAACTGRVLLVEDNELNMEIAAEFFSICGASVEKAWDGSEAGQIDARRLLHKHIYGYPNAYHGWVRGDQTDQTTGAAAGARAHSYRCHVGKCF